jgi:hypothetical protein
MKFLIVVFGGLGLFQLVRGMIALHFSEKSRGGCTSLAVAVCAVVLVGLIYCL